MGLFPFPSTGPQGGVCSVGERARLASTLSTHTYMSTLPNFLSQAFQTSRGAGQGQECVMEEDSAPLTASCSPGTHTGWSLPSVAGRRPVASSIPGHPARGSLAVHDTLPSACDHLCPGLSGYCCSFSAGACPPLQVALYNGHRQRPHANCLSLAQSPNDVHQPLLSQAPTVP